MFGETQPPRDARGYDEELRLISTDGSSASQSATHWLQVFAMVCNSLQKSPVRSRFDRPAEKSHEPKKGSLGLADAIEDHKQSLRPPCDRTPQKAILGLWDGALIAATKPCPDCHA